MMQKMDRLVKAAHQFKKLPVRKVMPEHSQGEYRMLACIAQMKEDSGVDVKVSQLAGQMQCSVPAVSKVLRTLEEKELLERQVDKRDRRNTFVVLTQKGEQRRLEFQNIMTEFSERVVKKMGEDRIILLTKLLEEMYLDASEVLEDIGEKQSVREEKGRV